MKLRRLRTYTYMSSTAAQYIIRKIKIAEKRFFLIH